MKVETMRRVDYWVGLPLCAFLSGWRRTFTLAETIAVKFFGKVRAKNEAPKNILLIELSEMGSAFLAHSAIEYLKTTHPDSKIYFLIFRRNKESAELLGQIDQERIVVIEDKSLLNFIFSTFSVLLRLRKIPIDVSIDLELFSRFTAILAYLIGAKQRIGFSRYTNEGLYRGSLITQPVYYNPHQHIAINMLALVSAVINGVKDPVLEERPLVKRNFLPLLLKPPIIELSESEKLGITEKLVAAYPRFCAEHHLVLINPDPGDAIPIRGWARSNFVELCGRILNLNQNTIIAVIGLPQSQSYAAEVIQAYGKDRCLDFTGRTKNLREVLALFSVAKLLVSNDGGLAHLASHSQMPAIVLFGPETPDLYGPLNPNVRSLSANLACSPCLTAMNHRHTICTRARCLEEISVERVFEAAKEKLGSPQLGRLARLRVLP